MNNVPASCRNCILLTESKSIVGIEYFCKLFGFDFREICIDRWDKSPALMPCPFCGSATAPMLVSSVDECNDEYYSVECVLEDGGCGAIPFADRYCYTTAEAVELWNTRKGEKE